jgi:hypothetical protein
MSEGGRSFADFSGRGAERGGAPIIDRLRVGFGQSPV